MGMGPLTVVLATLLGAIILQGGLKRSKGLQITPLEEEPVKVKQPSYIYLLYNTYHHC